MRNLYFIKVKEEYVEYLRKYDLKVQDNSKLKNNKPYIGILIQVQELRYFAPLSSPKKKHFLFDRLNNENKLPIDIFLIKDNKNKTIGVINFNNMIPVTEKNIIYFNIKEDKNYTLLKKEHIYCIKHKEEIIKKAVKVYNLVTRYKKESLIKRSCNFKVLEEQAKHFSSNILIKNN